ncbi:hypothetical protein H6P81_018084 [Aristolochia fimbriata]|uniref:Uncharacterized protein n=1 Tax=Aristolochia fimbriata TaxID=158543 RepID=A0AAV7E000_ARIFI|nr:hypothetical protein H6P81_018084 [Aristolochia fimbriata]
MSGAGGCARTSVLKDCGSDPSWATHAIWRRINVWPLAMLVMARHNSIMLYSMESMQSSDGGFSGVSKCPFLVEYYSMGGCDSIGLP